MAKSTAAPKLLTFSLVLLSLLPAIYIAHAINSTGNYTSLSGNATDGLNQAFNSSPGSNHTQFVVLPTNQTPANTTAAITPYIPSKIHKLVLGAYSLISGQMLDIKALLTYENLTPIPDQELVFYGNKTQIGSNQTSETGWAHINWIPNISGNYIINATYSGNHALNIFPAFNYTQFVVLPANQTPAGAPTTITLHIPSKIHKLVLGAYSLISGQMLDIKALLIYENLTPIPDQELVFYGNETQIGSNQTSETGWAQINWIPNISGNYIINATYSGNHALNVFPAFNYTRIHVLPANLTHANKTANNSAAIIAQADNATNNSAIILAQEITPVLTAAKKHFSLNENPKFEFSYITEEEFTETGKKSAISTHSKPEKASKTLITEKESISTFVYHNGKLTGIKPEIEKRRDGKFSIKLPKKRSLQAGIYKLKVNLAKDSKTYTQEQEFPWGLVSLNTRKSIYRPTESAEFIIVALDRNGHPVCNTDISLTVTDPRNQKTAYSTADRTITQGSECGIYNANYPTETEGDHTINITAIISDTKIDFSTNFLVKQDYEFDIIRTAESKIDPTRKDWFDVTVDIESFVGGDSLVIKEFVPPEFDVVGDVDIATDGDTKILTWSRNLTGNKTSVTYSYSVPHIWPYLYALGPLEILHRSETFREARPWYVAVDPTVTTNPPTACDSGYSSCSNAYTDDSNYASRTTTGTGEWSGYGFNLQPDDTVHTVKVKIKECTGQTQNAQGLEVWDGSAWLASHDLGDHTSCPTETEIDVTGDTTWNSTKVNAIKARVTFTAGGPPGGKSHWVYYIPIEVNFTSGNLPPVVATPYTYANVTLEAKTSFERSDGLTARVNVTDDGGASNISAVLIEILNTTGNCKVCNVSIKNNNITDITNGYTYEYNWTIPSDADIGTWNIIVYANDTSNEWGSNTVNFDVIIPGWLNVTLLAPDPSIYDDANPKKVGQNTTFWINATITCEGDAGASCGTVTGIARYNKTLSMPGTPINETPGATPFYIVGGEWWNTSWSYRKPVTVNGSTSALTDYPVNLTVNTVSDNIQDDCDDIRFTTSDGTLLHYWIESGCNTASTTIWVNVSSIPANTTSTIYMYYGNSSASDGSDGSNVFYYLDHWTSDNTGDWTAGVPFENQRHRWENTKEFTQYRELRKKSNLVNWWTGDYDDTKLGWVKDKSSYYADVDYVAVEWNQDTSDGATSTNVPVRLRVRNGTDTTVTAFKNVTKPSSSDNLYVTLKYSPGNVSYEWKNLDTGTVLASDYIDNSTQIPALADTKYFFTASLSNDGDYFSHVSPTYLQWGNPSFNGGMEWKTDYWFIRKYASTEPTASVGGEQERPVFSCGSMDMGDTCQLNLSVYATGAIDTLWKADVNFTSSYSQVGSNDTADATILITGPPPSNVVVKTYRNSSYADTDKFFDRQQTIYVEVNVTDQNGKNITDAAVTANFTVNSNVEKSIALSHHSGPSYRGNWTTNSTSTVGVYSITAYANNNDGSASGSNNLHLYSGESVSAYRIDYNEDGVNESVMENKHMVAVFNQADGAISPLLYARQKDTNVSYTFSQRAGNWWHNSWDYRKPITITNNNDTENLANYSVEIEMNLTDEYNAGRLQPDCDDIRFTCNNSGTETLLDFWIETCNISGGNSTIWVEVNYVESGGNATIYMYYGNPDAISESDGAGTFIFYQGFDDRSTGENSPPEWREESPDQGDFIVNETVNRGGPSKKSAEMHQTEAVSSYRAITEIDTQTGNLCWEFYGMAAQTDKKTYQRLTDEVNANLMVTLAFQENGQIGYYNDSWQDVMAYSADTWYKFKVYNVDLTNDQYDLDIDDVNKATNAGFQMVGSQITNIVFRGNYNFQWEKAYYDDIRIRKYISPEPSSSPGSEELRDARTYTGGFSIDNDPAPLNLNLTATGESLLSGKISGFKAWMYSSWGYREAVTVTNNNDTKNLTNYQARIETNLTDEYNAGKLQSDCSDIRFSYHENSGTETPQDFWIETCNTTGGNSTIWVKVTYIESSGNATIYMYYGNPSASSASDYTSTFDMVLEYSNDFEVSMPTNTQCYPSVAYGDGKFFLGWQDGRSAVDFDIYAETICPDCMTCKDDFSITTAGNDQAYPSVAYGDGKFIVAWHSAGAGDDVYAEILYPNGTVFKDDFSISTAANYQVYISVAYGDGKFFIAWQSGVSGSYDVYAEILYTNGTVYKDDFSISTAPNEQDRPSVAYGDGKFFVVWHNGVSGSYDIYAEILYPNGTVYKDDFSISTASNSQTHPSAAYGDGKFFVAWDDSRGASTDIYAEILYPNGTVYRDDFSISTAANSQTHPSAAYGDGKFFAAWGDSRGANTDIYAEILYPNGTVYRDDFSISTASDNQAEPSVAYGYGKFLVVWHDERLNPGTPDIYADTFRVRKYIEPEPSSSVGAEKLPTEESQLHLNITMRTEDVDYLAYLLYDFNVSASNLWSDIAGTLGSSASDDRYHLENGTDDLVTSLAKDQWNNYAAESNYSLIYDNSTSGDSVNDNVIAWIRFNESENITFQDTGLWNDSSGTGGLRIRYNVTNITATDEVNYILAFTKGDHDTIHQWMPTVEGGSFPTINFMTAPGGADENPPVITIQAPQNQSYNTQSIWFNATLNEPGDWCGYSLDATPNVTMLNTSGNWNNLTTVDEGTHNVTFSCNDTAGNMNSSAITEYFTVDTTYPQYSQNQTNSTEAGEDTLFSLYWTDNIQLAGYIFSFDNGTGTFENDSYVEMTGITNWSNATKTINSTQDTTIRWIIYANDTAGNMNTSSTYSFPTTSTGDSTPPIITIQSPENQSYPTTSIWFNATLNEPGSWCAYSLDGTPNVTMTNSSGNWNNLTTVGEGSHNVTFSCNDTAGNMNASAITEYFTVDITNPSVTITSPSDSSYHESSSFTITGTSTDSYLNYTNISLYNSAWSLINSTTNTSSNWAVVLGGAAPDGTYYINATAYDNASNTNQTGITIIIDVNSPYYFDVPGACNIDETKTYSNAVIHATCDIVVNGTTSANMTLTNTTLYAQKITVENSATLKIENSKNSVIHNNNFTIAGITYINNTAHYMNGSYNGEVGINVTSTGSLYIFNTSNITNGASVDGGNASAHYFFLVDSGSTFHMNDSTLSECGFSGSENQKGLLIRADNTFIINNTIKDNYIGLYFNCSDNNTIVNNTILDNENYGIYLNSSANSTIYNNLFNNTNNFAFTGTTYTNYWNTTKQSGTRIHSSGTEIGGNYWTNSTGNDYSDTCDDTNGDGFCDDYYNLTTGNIDWFPLSNKYGGTAPTLNFTTPTEPNGTTINTNWTEVNITITESNLDTFKFNWNSTNYTFYDDSLLLAMNFNNQSGIGENYNNSNGTNIFDISKYGNNGTLYVGADSSGNYTTGRFGGAYSFDGTDDYVDCGNDASLNITGTITIEAWIKANEQLDWMNALAKKDSYAVEFTDNPTEIQCHLFLSTGNAYSPKYTLSENEWTHVVFAYDNVYLYTYIDGTEVDHWPYTGTINVTANSLIIGSQNPWWGYFNGTIDEVRIYNRSLTADEIWFHYQSEFQKYNSSEWRFYNNITNLSDGTYTYYGWANDTAGNTNKTETRTLTIDTIPPTVTLIAPENHHNSPSSSVDFKYTPTDNIALANCSIWLNSTGTWQINTTDQTPTNNTMNTTSITLSDGTYIWNVQCYDNAGNAAFNETNYTLTVDTGAPPSITNIADNSPIGFGENVTINATVTDTGEVDTVLIEITLPNSTILANATMTNITATIYQYNYTDWENGTYAYTIYANDTLGNLNTSSGHTFDMYVNMTIQVRTLNDSYTDNEIVNLTDPPGFEELSSFLNSLITKTPQGEKPPTNNISATLQKPPVAANNIATIIAQEIIPVLTAPKNHFSLNENPEFEFSYITEEEFTETDNNSAISTLNKPKKASKTLTTEKETISTFVYHNGKLTLIKPEIEKLREGKFSVKIPRKRALPAGIYTLKVNLAKDSKTYTQEQEFTWGVLAINTHKSIYLENETAFIGIAVLDDNGKMVCDAPVTLEITDPLNNREILSTQNSKIKISPECSVYGVTNLPDYYAYYTVNSVGTYAMNLTAVTSNGIRSIRDTFTVQSSVDFDVARDGPTRIYPPVPYTMSFTIKANRDHNGAVKEYVPTSFEITPQDGLTVERKGDTKVLTWDRKLNKGETYSIYYEFDAPDISPYLFVLGGFGIGSFREERTWKIASDAEEEKWFENCADLGDWALEPSKGWSGGTECDSSGTEDNMTRGPTDLSDAYSANLSFWWKATKIDADEYFRVWVSDDNSIWVKMFEWVGDGSDIQGDLTDEYALEDNISLTSTVYIIFECKSGGGEHCYIDNINLSYIPDNPLNWSDPHENATTVYRNDKVRFNTTWEDDHGLSGYIFSISQGGSWVNSSFTGFGGTWNVSENITEITAATGAAVYWRFYANDSGNNWNQTDVQSFTVANSVVAENLTVAPQKVLNNTNVSISVDIASIKGSVDTVKAVVCYPNGTWMENVTLAGSGTYTGSTSKINFYPHGTYSVTIRANDSTGDVNDSVESWFTPYPVLSDSQNITINGSFGDWSGVKNVSDIIGDSGEPAEEVEGFNFTSISAGRYHSCGVLANGSAYCWGNGGSGQLGYGGTDQHENPVAVNIAPNNFTTISAGDMHSCGVLANGSAYCWGYGGNGRLGYGGTSQHNNPVAVNIIPNNFTTISAGSYHSCGVLANGSAYCWGSGSSGLLGYGGTDQHENPVAVNITHNFTSISAGDMHSCGVLANGSAYCWGSGSNGRLGYGGTSQHENPVAVNITPNNFTTISAGSYHSCGVLANGSAYCWGYGGSGQLGYGGTNSRENPVAVNIAPNNFTGISTGNSHSCGVLANGSAYCWGSGLYGQLGYGGTSQHENPVTVNITPNNFTTISAGEDHSCGVLANGSAYCWGHELYGRLGEGSKGIQHNPADVNITPNNFTGISAGNSHSCGVLANGSAYCWGNGGSGQLGYGGTSQHENPVAVNITPNNFTGISAGLYHSCGVLANGSAYCWGSGGNGQLGYGGTSQHNNPVAVNIIPNNFTRISAGWYHSCGVLANGSAYCWGSGGSGRLGYGGTSQHENPVAVNITPNNFTGISAGWYHSCGVLANGSAYCWGSGDNGRLGYGGISQHENPVAVNIAPNNFTRISAGDMHSCGVLANGSAYCWGYGGNGRLGYGGTSQHNNPVAVNIIPNNFTTISAGEDHSCGVLANGSAYCWGKGEDGQLGYGGTSQHENPVAVNITPNNFTSISAGDSHSCGVLANGSAYCWGHELYGRLGEGSKGYVEIPVAVSFDYPPTYDDFDLSAISLANNNTHLFALMEVNGTLDYSVSTEYYRLFISKNDSTGNETTPETGINLSVKYDYRVQVNGSLCYVYNSTNISNNISSCSFSSNSDTIELSVLLTDLNITTGDNINVTFETGSSTQSYDFAPDYRSFLGYDVILSAAGDGTPPIITIQSPENQSYPATSIWFNVTLNEPGDWCGYSLDGAPNVTMLNTSGNWNKENASMAEGSHSVTFSCNDTAGNMNSSAITEYFTVDLTYPKYSLNQTNTTEAGEDTLFSLYWTDNIALTGYVFSFDNGTGTFENGSYVEMTGITNWSNATKTINTTADTTIRWIIYANDTAGNMNASLNYSFPTTSTGDSTSPIITIQSPENQSYPTTSIWFNITLDEPGDWCGYSLDGASNITMTNSSGNWNKENASMAESSHYVTFSCNDTSGNMNSSAITEYFTVDLTHPKYTTYNPPEGSIFSKNAEVSFNVSADENTNMTVNYWKNSTIHTLTNTSYTLLPQNTSSPLSAGAYSWNFTICDPAGLCNQSGTYTFSIHGSLKYNEYRDIGSTTNLDFISADTNITNLILETAHGFINWTQNVTLNDTYDLDTAVGVTYNKIFVNTTKYPNLNKPAHLTMQNLNFGGVKILKDGADCPSSICQNITWDTQAGLLEFDVTEFSGYEAAEANQSKIDNNKTDSLNARIYVLMKVQFYQAGAWIDETTVVDDEVSRNISAGEILKLDSLFNNKWNTTQNASHGSGTYRVYAAVTGESSNVLKNIDGTWLNATYNFTVTLSEENPPIITIQSPQNTTYPTNSVWFNATLNEPGDWCAYSLDGAPNVTMTNSSGNWNKENTTTTLGSHSVTFSCNDTGGLMNTTDPLYFTIHNTTSINPVLTDSATPNPGDIVNLSARLLNASLNPIPDQNISFYYNDTCIGYNITNSTGWAVYTWDTSGVTPPGTYFINATFNGNDTLYAYRSHNDSTQIIISYKSISIHETDNATDKLWKLQGIPVNFNYYCYAGLDSCDDTYANNSDGDGTPANFTIENIGDTVDVVAYVTADYDNSHYYICSSNDTDDDNDHDSCKTAPTTGENGADNLQIYIPEISQWRSIPNTARDGNASALAIHCDISASTNISGIDFQVRAPYGTLGSYSATIIFTAYADICTNGQEGNYFQP